MAHPEEFSHQNSMKHNNGMQDWLDGVLVGNACMYVLILMDHKKNPFILTIIHVLNCGFPANEKKYSMISRDAE